VLASAPLLAGLIAGGLLVAVERRGLGERPALVALVLLLSVAAGVAPLRFALPAGIALAGFDGFYASFAGEKALYWNEIFVGAVAARTLLQRRFSRFELFGASAVAALFLGYLLSGTDLRAVAWGAKVLLSSAVLAWAVARSRTGRPEWVAAYHGLAFVVAGNLVLAVWQRSEGFRGLRALGFEKTELKEGPSGAIRAFGGLSSQAPFAYALTLAAICWLALMLGGRRDRSVAAATFWVPLFAVAGIVLSADRLAAGAIVICAVTGAIRHVDRVRAVVGAAAIVALLAAAIAFAGAGTRGFFAQSVDIHSELVVSRIGLWRDYLRYLTLFGAGPATAGSAYQKVAPPGLPVIFEGPDWFPRYTVLGRSYFVGRQHVVVSLRMPFRKRPQLVLSGAGRSTDVTRAVTFSLDDLRTKRVVHRTRFSSQRRTPFSFRIPAGRGDLGILVVVDSVPVSSTRPQAFPVEFWDVQLQGWREPPSQAERVRERRLFTGPDAGVVDNQYVSWIFEYGVAGVVLCLVFVGGVLRPLFRRCDVPSLGVAAGLTGVFCVIAAVVVNVWEETPTDLVAGIILGLAYGCASRGRAVAPALPVTRSGAPGDTPPRSGSSPPPSRSAPEPAPRAALRGGERPAGKR